MLRLPLRRVIFMLLMKGPWMVSVLNVVAQEKKKALQQMKKKQGSKRIKVGMQQNYVDDFFSQNCF